MSDGESSGSGLYEVEEIVDVSGEGKNRVFFVKWKGFDSSENTWEPEENLYECEDKITLFFEKRNEARLKAKRALEEAEKAKVSKKTEERVERVEKVTPEEKKQVLKKEAEIPKKESPKETVQEEDESEQESEEENLPVDCSHNLVVKAAKLDSTDVMLLVDNGDFCEYVKMRDLASKNSKPILDYFEILLRNKYSI